MITIDDIAKQAKVSKTTVSTILNNKQNAIRISQATSDRVKEIAAKAGFVPNRYARSLRLKRTYIVEMIVFDIADPYCAQIAKGVEHILSDSGYGALIRDMGNDDRTIERQLANIAETQADGHIVVARSKNTIPGVKMLSKHLLKPVVSVGINMETDGIPSVVVDNFQGAVLGIEHLFQKGHERIAIIADKEDVADSSERLAGVFSACQRKAGIPAVVRREGSQDDYQTGYEAVAKLLKDKHKPSAIFAFGDIFALGAMAALQEAGLKVPEDVSVIGFDDLPISTYFSPPLTTIRQPLRQEGEKAGEMLLRLMGGKVENQERTVMLEPTLILRRSTASLDGQS